MPKSQIPIQLIEDDIALAHSITGLLTTLNHSCTHYKSAEEFLNQIILNPPSIQLTSCIITDVRLPQMSGIELISAMKKNFKSCIWPIIIITGHGDVSMAVETLQKGAFGFLTKPFDAYELANKVNEGILKSEELKITMDFLIGYQNMTAHLTEQEKIIMQLLLVNKNSREISEKLGNSIRTIEVHRAGIYKKMGVHSLLQLAQIHARFELLKHHYK
jgi:two-component system response regulator DctR